MSTRSCGARCCGCGCFLRSLCWTRRSLGVDRALVEKVPDEDPRRGGWRIGLWPRLVLAEVGLLLYYHEGPVCRLRGFLGFSSSVGSAAGSLLSAASAICPGSALSCCGSGCGSAGAGSGSLADCGGVRGSGTSGSVAVLGSGT